VFDKGAHECIDNEDKIMQKNSMKNTIMLFLAAIIWGFAFAAQSAGMDYVGPFTFNAVRCIVGAVVLVPVALSLPPLRIKVPLLSIPAL